MWDLYPQFIKLSLSSSFPQDPEYVEKGYKQGLISREHIDHFKSLLLQEATTKSISHEDFDPHYVTHPNLRPYEEELNASHKLFDLNDKHYKALEPILEELKEPVAACLGTPWRVINILCWETFPEAHETGPNSWHTDGLPFAVNKVMIYLTGANKDGGTTILKFEDGTSHYVEGPIGTWMLFKISEILHKGEKPKQGSRVVLEVRVVPSFNFDLRPYSAGFNAHYPIVPWHQCHLTGS